MCTPSKIMMYDYQSDKFITYDESDGLQNGSFHKAFWVPHNGKLLIGGSDGINMFYPKQLSTESTIYPIILTDFQIFNRSIAPSPDGILKNVISQTKKITLKESQSVITFAFSAPDVISPNKIKYRYMMEGFDRDWTYTNYDRRSATYTNLAPGEYIFRVMASNRNGVWEENETSIAIEILPPLWKTNAAYFIYFLIIIAVIFLIIRYMVIRERDRHSIRMARLEAKQAIEMETLRTNLFTDISHEFRTPLTLIIGPLSRIIESGRYMKEDAQNFGLIHRNAKRLQRLINQFLDFRKIEQGEMRLNFKYGEIVGFVREVVDTFSFMASEKNIEYSFVSSIEELRMHFDPDKIEKILYNLISNALKYTPENGKVTINLSCVVNYNKHTLSIAVSDTGIGISEEGKKNLFSLFYRDSRSSTIHADGFGVGLSMTKTLVELHGGTISVESEQGCGSQFNVILPIDSDEQQTDLKEDEYLVQSELTPFKLPKDGMTSSDLPAESLETVLIVEDNNDMRIYIKSILPSHYTIHEAKDGYEGYNLATEIIPDIIISDIMMPVMDGMKMVELLRSNEKSNHIPIIFLTARHTEGQIVEGLSLGAEDYVTKPFSAEILRARIKNILNNRRKLWETYNRTDSISELGKQITDSPAKIEFIEKLNKVISLHMSDISFGVDILASELNMSVDQLSRKLRAFTNDTPYNIIFKARMQYAIELMKDGRKNITEITYEVGYKEVSNFSRAFKKHFGLSPKEYINSLQ